MSRVLVISRNYPPLWGGMERLNLNLVEQLSGTHEIVLLVPVGAAAHAPGSVEVCEVPGAPLSRFLVGAMVQGVALARRFKPHAVLGGSGLVAPMVLASARVSGARSAVYAHGLDLAVQHVLYRMLWMPALRRVDQIIANSSATRQLALEQGVRPGRIHLAHPGVSMPQLDAQARQRFRRQHQFGDGPLLLSVGRLTTRKGLCEFVADVLPSLVKKHPELVLAVIGDVPNDALYAKAQTPESILAVAEQFGVARNVRFLGKRFGSELDDAYAGADVHVFPVRALHGDPEGFGMVAVEAAAHGLPTAAYATGGVVDAVRDGVSGRLVGAGDDEALSQAILELIENPLPPEQAKAFAAEFAWDRFGARVQQILFDSPSRIVG